MKRNIVWGGMLAFSLSIIAYSCKKDRDNDGIREKKERFDKDDEKSLIDKADEISNEPFANRGLQTEFVYDTIRYDTTVVVRNCVSDGWGGQICTNADSVVHKLKVVVTVIEKNGFDYLVQKLVDWALSNWRWMLKKKWENAYYDEKMRKRGLESYFEYDKKNTLFAGPVFDAMHDSVDIPLTNFSENKQNLQHPQQVIDRGFEGNGPVVRAIGTSAKGYMIQLMNNKIGPGSKLKSGSDTSYPRDMEKAQPATKNLQKRNMIVSGYKNSRIYISGNDVVLQITYYPEVDSSQLSIEGMKGEINK